ncbi:hypothetical protein [Delftia sp. ZNC0008]|uniref:hypothetical protein n=1 Tax=Delftia sp. ZNC0008 TaxID=1339242 RepID=UPI000AF0C315|nr:hypothetical protein [Delftia sp. ZNC0008]
MLNTTRGQLVINLTGKELDLAVRLSLEEAATALVGLYGAEDFDLAAVTTKTRTRLAYAKYVCLCTLVKRGVKFDESYVLEAFAAESFINGPMSKEAFYRLTLAEPDGPYPYRPSYRATVQFGLGFFLIALHSRGAITLPFSFRWPFPKRENKARMEITPFLGSELIKLVRSVGDAESPYAEALESVTTHKSRRTWFLSHGTKLLLSLGWNQPEDVNLDDLIKLKEANDSTDFSRCGRSIGYRALVTVLERRYGADVNVSVRAWDEALRDAERKNYKTSRMLSSPKKPDSTLEVFSMLPSDALPERIIRVKSLPGLDVDFSSMRKTWIEIQRIYIRKLRVETTKEKLKSIGYLNLYLFFYLPYWFDQHRDTKLNFPSKPNQMLVGIFISRLIPHDFEVPLTFLEFIEECGQRLRWAPVTHYMTLKNVAHFFEFLERNSKELPGCQGFTQPLAKHDFPSVGRSAGTNKRPIPRRLFAFYIAYVEALVTYTHVVLERILASEIAPNDLSIFNPKLNIIDTLRASVIVGYVPMVFFRGKAYRLQFLPNCLDLGTFRLKDGRTLRIPQPHGLHHVLVAIYTGIRNQHIQWLDARTFASKVHPDDVEITKLLVNTDKVKTTSWEPHVNMRVIEVLREQLRWRNLIDCLGFNQEVYYERNPKTKWPSIVPLFSVEDDGHPHPDSRYATIWSNILMGVQGMLSEIDCGRVAPLLDLLPPNIPYSATDRRALLKQHVDSTERSIVLIPKSDITPHSARVGVVSYLITVLPAEFIGRYVTGQHTGVVYHYVHIDDDDVRAAQAQQSVELQIRAYGKEFDTLVAAPHQPNPHFIRADGATSAFSQAMQQNMDETLASYGCVTLSLREDGRNGIDILRETRGANASFNKTEVCPFGNHCPPDVLKDLRGIGRCGMCPYAVRSVDHLPAVVAKVKQGAEQLEAIEYQLDADDFEDHHSDSEQEQLEAERQRLGDELAAWKLVSEVLEVQRRLLEVGQDSRRWVVSKPDIIQQSLQRLAVPTNDTAYILARLAESVAYPTFDSPEIKARFDLLRRQLLANAGNIRAALMSSQPPDVASQCAGLLRTIVEANGLNYRGVVALLTTDMHLQALPEPHPPVLLGNI